MIHRHHIVPRHMGGTDDPSNIAELTVKEHADAHNLLWCLHKNKFDKIAELSLLGTIGKEEIVSAVLSEAGRKGGGYRENGGRKLEKVYLAISPLGKEYIVLNGKSFCKDKDLDHGTFCKVAKGTQNRKQHRGWRVSFL